MDKPRQMVSSGKAKLDVKREFEAVRSRLEAERIIVEETVGSVSTAGGLHEFAIGGTFEPPFLCEWILPIFWDILCGPPYGTENNIKLEKAVYGVTKYGWSFYDPGYTVYHIIRTAKWAIVRPEISKKLYEILTGSGDYEPAAAHTVFQHRIIINLVRLLVSSGKRFILRKEDLYQALPKIKINGREYYVVYDSKFGAVAFDTIEDLLMGTILNITPLGVGYLFSYGTEILSPWFWTWLSAQAVDVIIRFNPGFGATKASKKTYSSYGAKLSNEAESWGEFRQLYRFIMRRVWLLLENSGLGMFERQAYVNAAVELAFSSKPPRSTMYPYVRKYKYDMDWDSLYRHWKAKWEALGLKGAILDKIAEEVRGIWERLRIRYRLLELLQQGR